MPVAVEDTTIPYYDIVVLGAGFSGVKALHEARKRGLTCHVFESSAGLGGTWRNNHYPGARVDSPVPIYQLNIPEVYTTWKWKERYPSWKEIREYFAHVEKVLHVKKDITFNTYISKADFDKSTGLWTLQNKDGSIKAQTPIFMPCIGFASKTFTPVWKNFDKYKGRIIHSSEWPEEEHVVLKDQKVAVIGTGSTGVQLVQESGPIAKELFVFQRTPNLAIPMRQVTDPEQDTSKYSELLEKRYEGPGGFLSPHCLKKTFEDTPEEREKFYQHLYDVGGFHLWISNYCDLMTNQEANDETYKFWRKTIQKRINDPEVAEKLAPEKPPHPFGAKRPSLERNYYDQFNRPNVHLVDVKANPIEEFYENGIITADGTKHEFDVLLLATGFDAVTGSFKNIEIRNAHNGTILRDDWEEGCHTYLGLSVNGYPNMFFTYGPQSPTAFSNGPTCVELQFNFIFKLLDYMKQNNVKYVEARKEAEEAFSNHNDEFTKTTLYPKAETSWYMGTNIPGKKPQMLNYICGVPSYANLLQQEAKKNFNGFSFYQ